MENKSRGLHHFRYNFHNSLFTLCHKNYVLHKKLHELDTRFHFSLVILMVFFLLHIQYVPEIINNLLDSSRSSEVKVTSQVSIKQCPQK
jgi:hypothetical protein